MPMAMTYGAAVATTLSDREEAIARSVIYAGLFDYPLSLAQLRQTLIECALTPTEIRTTYQRSDRLRRVVDYEQGRFCPIGRRDLIEERRRREARSRVFLHDHRWFLRLLCAMPWVRMVALSGSIAHRNLEGGGDLDLFIVTSRHRVWCVTVATVLLAKLLRRRATVCANFVVDESHLAFEPPDLFSASQIVHLKPLSGAGVYQQLLAQNPFVLAWYPNFHHASSLGYLRHPRGAGAITRILEAMLFLPGALAEACCRPAYRAYLRRRAGTWRSPEQVRLEAGCLKLHTHSHRQRVMGRFSMETHNLTIRT